MREIVTETCALEAMGKELLGSEHPIVVASGTPWIAGRASTEADPPPLEGPVGGRGRAVQALLDLAPQGVRSVAVRIPRTAHEHGKRLIRRGSRRDGAAYRHRGLPR